MRQPRTMDGLAAYTRSSRLVAFGDDRQDLIGAQVSPAIFRLLGVAPAIGRPFTEAEATEGAARVVILSDRLWRERFGGRDAALGSTLVIDDEPHTIIAIARPDFRFPDPRVLFWTPYVIASEPSPAAAPRAFVVTALGRLKRGVTAEQAEAEGTAAARSFPRPGRYDLMFGKGGAPVVHVRPLGDDMTATVRPAILVVWVAVAVVLLMACANVANLCLSRGVARQRELAVRAAVGAGRARLARQLLTESLVLAAAGGTLGLLLAAVLLKLVPRLAPAGFPRLDDVRVDGVLLACAVVTTLFTAVAAGLVPARRGAGFSLVESLRGGDGATAGGFRGTRARRARDLLLVSESAFAVLLLVAAALLARSFVRLVQVDPGYTADHVLTARIQMPRGTTPERSAQFVEGLLGRVRGAPGVTTAGVGSMMPLNPMTAVTTFVLPSEHDGEPRTARALLYTVTPGYADVLRLRLRAGRLFTDADVRPGLQPMIVNEDFVRQYLGSGPVPGRRFTRLLAQDTVPTEIVGVVGNVLKDGNDRDAQPEMYFLHQSGRRFLGLFLNLVVRTTGEPSALAATVRTLTRDIDPGAVVSSIDPLPALVSASVSQPRFATTVLATIAGLALLLAGVGLYGVLSYAVSQRRRELGVRAALGADRSHLVTLVVREGLSTTIVGVVLGVSAAMGLTRLMEALLFGVTPLDPVSFAIAPAVLVGVAAAACLGPAWRAASTDPAIVLRNE